MREMKGIIFDYGGTLDTNGVHWSEVLWKAYQKENIKVTKEAFRDAYVFAERRLEAEPVVLPEDNFLAVLRKKTDIETRYLMDNGIWEVDELTRRPDAEHIALDCYIEARKQVSKSIEILKQLAGKYKLALVSNFYGNLESVLSDFGFDCFSTVVESAVVGVRKPDARIFSIALERMGLNAEEVVVVGDSLKNDIMPAKSVGYKTMWLKGIGWNGTTEDSPAADHTIGKLEDILRHIDSCWERM